MQEFGQKKIKKSEMDSEGQKKECRYALLVSSEGLEPSTH